MFLPFRDETNMPITGCEQNFVPRTNNFKCGQLILFFLFFTRQTSLRIGSVRAFSKAGQPFVPSAHPLAGPWAIKMSVSSGILRLGCGGASWGGQQRKTSNPEGSGRMVNSGTSVCHGSSKWLMYCSNLLHVQSGWIWIIWEIPNVWTQATHGHSMISLDLLEPVPSSSHFAHGDKSTDLIEVWVPTGAWPEEIGAKDLKVSSNFRHWAHLRMFGQTHSAKLNEHNAWPYPTYLACSTCF